jgi:hypothetical protein
MANMPQDRMEYLGADGAGNSPTCVCDLRPSRFRIWNQHSNYSVFRAHNLCDLPREESIWNDDRRKQEREREVCVLAIESHSDVKCRWTKINQRFFFVAKTRIVRNKYYRGRKEEGGASPSEYVGHEC